VLVSLGMLPNLRHVVADACKLTTVGLARFFALINTRLDRLSLKYIRTVNDAAMVELGKHCTHITELNLYGCFALSDIGLLALARCTQLQALDVSLCAALTDAGFLQLLPKLPHLQRLILFNCSLITERTMECLSMHNPCLRHVDLHGLHAVSARAARSLSLSLLAASSPAAAASPYSALASPGLTSANPLGLHRTASPDPMQLVAGGTLSHTASSAPSGSMSAAAASLLMTPPRPTLMSTHGTAFSNSSPASGSLPLTNVVTLGLAGSPADCLVARRRGSTTTASLSAHINGCAVVQRNGTVIVESFQQPAARSSRSSSLSQSPSPSPASSSSSSSSATNAAADPASD
jgi:hypothetical protein